MMLLLLLLLLTGGSAQIRELAFPPVDLKLKDSGLSVSFRHPSLFYTKLKNDDEAVVTFIVTSDAGHFQHTCTEQNDDCRLEVPVPAGVSRCVRLRGSLLSKYDGEVMLTETPRICLSDVPAPANVTLSCRNVNVSVSWDFRGPPTTFRVHTGGSAGHVVEETTEHHYDLNAFVWESADRYLGFHYVTVTTMDGGNQSESVTSQTFSFNEPKSADIKCELDFPPVEVVEKDSGATVSFRNPLKVYRELQLAHRTHHVSVKFTVSTDAENMEDECTAQQQTCRRDISFPEDVKKKCVNVTGSLAAESSAEGEVLFTQTGPVCASTPTEDDTLLLTIMLFVLVIVVGVLILCVCKVKAWTTKNTPDVPKSLIPAPPQHSYRHPFYVPVPGEECSAVRVTDSICKNPPVCTEEEEEKEKEKEEDHKRGSSALCDSCPPAPEYREGGLSEGYGRDDDSANDSMKTETVSTDLEEEEEVEEEEEERSPYDRRHAVWVDMGDGDMVTGYSER